MVVINTTELDKAIDGWALNLSRIFRDDEYIMYQLNLIDLLWCMLDLAEVSTGCLHDVYHCLGRG